MNITVCSVVKFIIKSFDPVLKTVVEFTTLFGLWLVLILVWVKPGEE